MSAALGLDIGTTNVKAVLVAPDGRQVGCTHRGLRTHRQGPVAEQDAGAMWANTVDAIAELTSAHPEIAAQIGAIGVCSQYSSIVPVDANIEPVGPMVIWADQRGTDHSYAIMERDDDAFLTWVDKHGIPTIGGGLSLAHLLHLEHDNPEVHEATATYLEPMDFVTARLTGRITATQHSVFMSQLCDNRTLDTLQYDDELLALAGVDPSRLPPLIDMEEPVGTIDQRVASELGVSSETIVYAGCNDTAGVGVASGIVRPGRAGLAIGTTSVVVDSVDKKETDFDHEILSMPGLSRDRYQVFAENGYGGRMVEYVLDQIVYAGDTLAEHSTDDLFSRLEVTLAETRPGSGGALFLPWLGGSMAPSASPDMRGGFINVSLATRRIDLVRAAAEGVAHNLAWLLPHVEAFTDDTIDELAFVGGAARSSEWCQILADVVNRPVAPAVEPGTAVARAIARLALARLGVLDRADVEDGVELGNRFEPRPEHRPLYELHQQQFEAAFEALRPISEALNTFHGDNQ